MNNESPAILIEKERGIDTFYLGQIDWLAPPLVWILGLDEKVTFAHICRYHIEGLVPRVILDVRSINAPTHALFT